MKVPISWLKDFVDITLPLPELAHRLTMAGLEVEEIHYIGLAMPKAGEVREVSITGIEWDPEKIVVASITEVMPHPNADRLTLCKLNDGQQEHVVLTGAPNLFDYKGKGTLEKALKVAYAKEGARIYDGHQEGQVLVTLKRTKIRGVESYSMVCSEKELGISEEHEGILFLDDDAPVGMPLCDYIGDAVLDIAILPNVARCANILGVAREVSALTGAPLHVPPADFETSGQAIGDLVDIEITHPPLNPRFVLGLIRNVAIRPSAYKVQLRLKHAGMRPINNIVDATNYAMLAIGEPLHAFDYDVLAARARRQGSDRVTIITRTAHAGEKLTTLDDVERTLDTNTVLVCDSAGALSIAGVMGGQESEISDRTRNILLEGAAWHYTNIRRTAQAQKLPSEASYRFSRGVHPTLAEEGVKYCLGLMAAWSDGKVAPGLVDNYPLPPPTPEISFTPKDVKRWLGISLNGEEIVRMLAPLGFIVHNGTTPSGPITLTPPNHRLDIGEELIGMADVMEEIARIYGYDRLPETRIADELPPLRGNPELEREERVRDILVSLGLQEVISHRLTSPEREARRLPQGSEPDNKPYVQIANPIASDRTVMRHSVLSLMLEAMERNARVQQRVALFEIGPVFLASEAGALPDERNHLDIVLTGERTAPGWQDAAAAAMDFYDLKGIVETLIEGLHIRSIQYKPGEHPTFHPGKCAKIWAGDAQIGVFGELHPLVKENYDLPTHYAQTAVLAAEFNLDALLALIPSHYETFGVPDFPPVLEDLAVVVDEATPAAQVAATIREAGGKLVNQVHLFDVYRSEQIGAGKKSLAYSVTYQAADKTLTDKDVSAIRSKIVRRLEQSVGAKLRG
ncbi:MAG: phenylalanine--tRNA ligase subunit beta [Chloroflexota bacterium]